MSTQETGAIQRPGDRVQVVPHGLKMITPMSLISINEEMSSAGLVVAGGVEPERASTKPTRSKHRNSSSFSTKRSSAETARCVEIDSDKVSDARLYLAAMTYFFSDRA